MSNTLKTRMTGKVALLRALENSGSDVEKILHELGLNIQLDRQEEDWVPFDKYAQLLERIALETGDPYFGLHVSKQVGYRDYGPIGFMGLSANTLGDYFRQLERYTKVVNEAFSITVSVTDDAVVVTYQPERPSYGYYRQVNEFYEGLFFHTYQYFIDDQEPPIEINFCHSIDGSSDYHEKFFGCRVNFDTEYAETILPLELFSRKTKFADSGLFRIMTQYCESVMAERAGNSSDLMVRFEQLLLDLLPTGRANAEFVAAELGMSERTLARRLASANTSFKQTLDILCQKLAQRYIRQSEFSLSEIAFLLGYSNQSSFTVAFKR